MIDPKDASYIQDLEREVAKLRSEIEQKDTEIKRLKREKGISSASEGLSFNDKTGTHTDANGKHFCTKCLAKEKRNQLKVEPHGWRCMVCDEYYEDPDNPEGPLQIVPDMGGPQGWMR